VGVIDEFHTKGRCCHARAGVFTYREHNCVLRDSLVPQIANEANEFQKETIAHLLPPESMSETGAGSAMCA
jgi:hypothetical protein